MRYEISIIPKLLADNSTKIHDSRPNLPNFIDTYIFPGGYLPTTNLILQSIHSGSHGRLEIRTVQSIGPHYAKTLRSWREKFQANWESEIKPMLLLKNMGDERKRISEASDSERQKKLEWEVGVLKRKWEVRCKLIQFRPYPKFWHSLADNILLYSITFPIASLVSVRVS